MDNFVDNHFLLPEITFGDFSRDEISQFFRLERAGSNVNISNMATIDDNPFLQQNESNSSLTEQVGNLKLHLTKSTSFPNLSSIYKPNKSSLDIQFIGANDNKNNPGTSKESQPAASTSPTPGTSAGASGSSVNPFASSEDDELLMDIEDNSDQVGLNELSKIVSHKNLITPKIKPKNTSKLPLPHFGSPVSLKRLTRASARLPAAEFSGVVLRSKSKTKSIDKNKKLQQNMSNLFNLDHLNLTQLVSTQSETNALKLTIRRRSIDGGENLRSFSDTNLAKVNFGHSEPTTPQDVLSETPRLRKKPRSDRAPNNVCSDQPKPQRSNTRPTRRATATREAQSNASGVSADSRLGSPTNLASTPITETPGSSILNKRIEHPVSPILINDSNNSFSNNSSHTNDLLTKLRESVDNMKFDPTPQPSTSKNILNLSKQLTVRFNNATREVSINNKGNSKVSKKPLDPKQVKTWDFYQKSKDINPFVSLVDEGTQHVVGQTSPIQPRLADNSTNIATNIDTSLPSLQVPKNKIKKIFEPAESILDSYKTSLANEMTLRLHVNMLDVQIANDMFPNWAVSYNPPPNLINTMQKALDLVEKRRELAVIMMKTNRSFYKRMLDETVEANDSLVSSLRAIYREKVAVGFDLDFALNTAVEHATDAKASKFDELNVIMNAIRAAPEAALWLGISSDFERPPRAQKVSSNPKPTPPNSPNIRAKKNAANNSPGGQAQRNPRPPSRQQYKNYYRPRSTSKGGPKKSNKRKRDDLATRIGNAVQSAIQNII